MVIVQVEKKIKKVYLWSTQVRPSRTLLHMPLENSLEDTSSYWRVATTSGSTATFATIWWVSALQWYSTTTRVNIPMTDFTSDAYTQSAWYYANGWSDWKCFWGNKSWTSYLEVTFVTNSGNWNKWSNYYSSDTFSSLTYSTWAWHMITITRDGNSQIMYHDWVAFSTETKTNLGYTYSSIDLLRRSDYWQQRPWYISDFLVLSNAWSASEVLAYYNSTKSKYWY